MGVHMEKRRGGSNTLMGVSLKSFSLGLLTIQFSTFILLLHYSRIMPTPDGHRYLPSTAVFLVELLKLGICLTISLYEVAASSPRSSSATALLGNLTGAIFAGDSWKMALPAGLYTLANSLQYVGISNLDAATFHVTYQLKIIVTAVLSVSMLGRSLSMRQWLSLVLLTLGVAIVSIPHGDNDYLSSSHHTRVYVPRSSNPFMDHLLATAPALHLTKRSATYEGIIEDEALMNNPAMDGSLGVAAVISVCVFSGWAGVYFEKVIKTSPSEVSLWIRNVQLSAYSLFPAFFVGVLFLDGEQVAKYGFFAGYNWVVVVSIIIQALGGIVASFCLYYADNISKNFAVSISMVLSSLASFLFLGFTATSNFLIGSGVVLAATYLYSIQDSRYLKRFQPPVIRVYGDSEKPRHILSPIEENDVSIQIPKTPLTAEEMAVSTSRPGSPAHKKRKNDLGYFTKSHG